MSENWVNHLLTSVNEIFDQHLPNMQTYIKKFEPFSSLLNGEEAEAVSQFIHNTKDMEIFEISRKIDSIRKVRLDIEQLDLNVDLGLFYIDCSQLNKFLAQSTQDHGLFLVLKISDTRKFSNPKETCEPNRKHHHKSNHKPHPEPNNKSNCKPSP